MYSNYHKTPKGITPDRIMQTIDLVHGSSIETVAEKLEVRHTDIAYHFNKHPFLREHYKLVHKNYIGQKDEEVKQKVEEAIITARQNSPINEIAKSCGIGYGIFYRIFKKFPDTQNIYSQYHPKRKIRQKTLDRLESAIKDSPKGTPVSIISQTYKLGITDLFDDFPEYREMYEKIHGKIHAGGVRNSEYTLISTQMIVYSINKLPKGASISALARALGASHGRISYYFKRKPFLRQYYEYKHDKKHETRGEKMQRIKDGIIHARKNSPLKEIAASMNECYSNFTDYIRRHQAVKDVYNQYHPGRKVSQKVINRIRLAILSAPKGTKIYHLQEKYGMKCYDNLRLIPELKELYERVHGIKLKEK